MRRKARYRIGTEYCSNHAKNVILYQFAYAPTDTTRKGEQSVPTVKLVDEDDPNPLVQEVFRDIKATKNIDFVPAIWRALAAHPQHLSLCWTRLKAIMRPGKL